jgi:hypothetical protein
MLAQDNDGDILIDMNKFSLVDGLSEIRQRLIQNLRTFLGEWFLDTTLGVPYHQLIFEKDTPPTVVEDLLKNAILETVGVTGLKSWQRLDLSSTRELRVSFIVSTSQGDLSIEETL